MSGPLPAKDKRRRNAPTIPTTSLPLGGFTGPIPRVPKVVTLRAAGADWWRWAWRTPQAAAWSSGNLRTIARRAQLEDDLQALDSVDHLDALDLLQADKAADFKFLIQRLAALSSGRLAVCREMRELDDRLGLTPRGMAALRWEVVAVTAEPVEEEADEVTKKRQDRRSRLSAS